MQNLAFEGNQQEEYEATERDVAQLQSTRAVPRVSIQAFCETEGVALPIERAAEDRRMANAHVKVHRGGIEAAIEHFRSSPTPNLILVETRAEPAQLIASLESLAEVCDPNSRVVVIGHYNDVPLYRDLIRAGISEYVVAPVSLADVIETVSGIFIDPDAAPLGSSIAFVGAKGGVGSSTIAHNVSWSMSTLFESEVVIADMDLAFGTANINFDQDPPQGIAEAVFAPERVDEVYLDRLLSKCSEHLSLLAAPSTLDRVYDFNENAFSEIIDTIQRTAPTLILDVPHLWTAWNRSTLARADEVVITATPELANLRNTKNLMDVLTKMRPNDGPPRLIINQVGVPKRPEIDPSDFADPLEVEPIAIIPFDPQLFGTASNNGRMLGEMEPDNTVSRKIDEIAHILTGRTEVKKQKAKGLSGFLSKLTKKT